MSAPVPESTFGGANQPRLFATTGERSPVRTATAALAFLPVSHLALRSDCQPYSGRGGCNAIFRNNRVNSDCFALLGCHDGFLSARLPERFCRELPSSMSSS